MAPTDKPWGCGNRESVEKSQTEFVAVNVETTALS